MRSRTLALVLACLLPSLTAGADDDDETPTDDDDEVSSSAARPDDADEDADAEPDEDEARPTKKKKKKKRKKKRKPAAADDEPAITTTGPVAAHDVTPPRVIFAAEALGAAPLDGGNRALFGMGGGVGLGLEIYLAPLLGLHAGAELVYLAKDASMSSTTWIGGHVGPRVHLAPKLFGAHTRNDAWIDAHVSYGASGGIRRPGFDVGAAIQWEVAPAIRIGPMLRYQFGSDPRDSNAQLVTLGLAIGFGGRTRTAIRVDGDSDGDGLVDRLDECPDEVPGDRPDPEREGCPMRDGDGDGVADADDACPEEPFGEREDPERRGCPFPDRDGDLIADDADRCPDDPGPARVGEPTHGCPLARVANQKIEILQQIFFDHNSATISEGSQPVLEAVAAVMKKLGDASVRVEGHTDEVGSDAVNLDLSRRRARAVAQWLIENAGIDATRLQTTGYGKSRPLVSGSTADTGKNRRVEFVIIEAK